MIYPSVEPEFNPVDFWIYELAYDIRKEHVLEAEEAERIANNLREIENLWSPHHEI